MLLELFDNLVHLLPRNLYRFHLQIYLNNKSKGSGILKGLTPSLFDDIMNITPERLMAIISGYSVGGGGLLPCKEGYVDYNLPQYNIYNLHLQILYLWFVSQALFQI